MLHPLFKQYNHFLSDENSHFYYIGYYNSETQEHKITSVAVDEIDFDEAVLNRGHQNTNECFFFDSNLKWVDDKVTGKAILTLKNEIKN